jgi:hypothetical protein
MIQFEVLSGIRKKKAETVGENDTINGENIAVDNIDSMKRIERKYLNKIRNGYHLSDSTPYMKFISLENQDYITREEFIQFQSIGKSRKFKKNRDDEFEFRLEQQLKSSMQATLSTNQL